MDTTFLGWITGGLRSVCGGAATLFAGLGVAMLVWGGLRALWCIVRRAERDPAYALARLDLGRHLALSLEFLVAKDVLDSIVEPTWDELGQLAAVVVLRTVIQWALARELRELNGDD